jgi:hypothetical protein
MRKQRARVSHVRCVYHAIRNLYNIYIHIYLYNIYIHIYICIYVYMYVCVCVFVCVCIHIGRVHHTTRNLRHIHKVNKPKTLNLTLAMCIKP